MFTCFNIIRERDVHPDRQTDRHRTTAHVAHRAAKIQSVINER